MAIIKCPECGHQVSEKAPTCPNCGVVIAGNLVRCGECGEIYLRDQAMCPSCHCPTPSAGGHSSRVVINPQTTNVAQQQTTYGGGTQPRTPSNPPKKSSSGWTIFFCFLFACAVFGGCYYFYSKSDSQKEQEDYEYAMKSDDPLVLQSYLNRYKDGNPAHRDSVNTRLSMLSQIDEDWTNAVVSGTKKALEDYLRNHPESVYRAQALNKIDSIDFVMAEKDKTVESYQEYLNNHPNGQYSTQAQEIIANMKLKTIVPEDEAMVKGIFRRFFQSINSHNEDGLLSTATEIMTTLLNKTNVPKTELLTMMSQIYKDNVSNLNWYIQDDYQIVKSVNADNMVEYSVSFTAEKRADLIDGTQDVSRYRIRGTVDNDGRISAFSMSRLNY